MDGKAPKVAEVTKKKEAEKPKNKTALVQEKKVEEMSEQELQEHNEDQERQKAKQKKEEQQEFDAVPDDTKLQVMSDQLGVELVQIEQELGVKGKVAASVKSRKLQQMSLA